MTVQPIVEEIDYLDPVDAVSAFASRPGLVLLDSAMEHPRLAAWSWLGVDPFGRFLCVDGKATWNGTPLPGDATKALRRQIECFRCATPDQSVRFTGGASGYFSYEAGSLYERLPRPKWRGAGLPEIDLWFHDVGVAFDVIKRRAFVVSTGWPSSDDGPRRKRARERAAWLRESLSGRPARPGAPVIVPRAAWRPNMSPTAFRNIVERTRKFIVEGDIFQANLAQAFRAELPADYDPLALYRQLRAANAAPFGALLVTAERIVASTSPEGFLLLDGDEVETRPIKGTRRRSPDPCEDSRLASELLGSEKDRAENIMIVDLMRNDLSRVCLPGTVKAPVLCGLETYASVHHLVSEVRGRLRLKLDALHLLSACFPGGSVTGAPKIRAMEIIHELEPEARGVYCGSIVYLGFDGSLRSNIAIRTLVAEGRTASIHAGGGITLLSDPEEEYAETLTKAERMLAAFEPEHGPVAGR